MIILRVLKLQTERQCKYFLFPEEMGTCELKPLPFEANCVLAVYLKFECFLPSNSVWVKQKALDRALKNSY